MPSLSRRWLLIVLQLFAFGLFAAPVAAQQTAPDQSTPPSAQTAPAVPLAPPEATQTCPDGSVIAASASCPAPPPFPPMPSRAPHHRWVDVGSGAAHAHRHAVVRHHAGHRHHHRPSQPTTHMSKRTIRFCHGLTHRQMMRHSKCRALAAEQHQEMRRRHHVASRHVAYHRRPRRHRS